MNKNELSDDILFLIYKKANITCHVCKRRFTHRTKLFKKINRNYFCSKICYTFI